MKEVRASTGEADYRGMHTHTHEVVEDTGTANVSKHTGLLDIHVVTLWLVYLLLFSILSYKSMRQTSNYLCIFLIQHYKHTHNLLERHIGKNIRLYLGWRIRGCIVIGSITKKERGEITC